ncbi:hypothetical protein DYH09_35685 [bacterium CPR1]|nr:hypothetical protein [bacterium CPR1]
MSKTKPAPGSRGRKKQAPVEVALAEMEQARQEVLELDLADRVRETREAFLAQDFRQAWAGLEVLAQTAGLDSTEMPSWITKAMSPPAPSIPTGEYTLRPVERGPFHGYVVENDDSELGLVLETTGETWRIAIDGEFQLVGPPFSNVQEALEALEQVLEEA